MIELHGRIDPVKTLQGTMKAVAGDVYDVPPAYIEPKLQAKTATPTGENQKIVPDDGYDGLSSVAINAVLLQTKTVNPEKQDVYVQPDNGYTGLSIVCVKAMPKTADTISVDFCKNGNVITATSTQEDGATETSEITLDQNGYPVSIVCGDESSEIEFTLDELGYPSAVTINGGKAKIGWEGFDV